MARKPHSITIEPEVWERAKLRHGSNMSNYIETLMKTDCAANEAIELPITPISTQ